MLSAHLDVLAETSPNSVTGVGGVVTGALVALVSAVVIPFLTTQFSLWSETRRQSFAARRGAIAAVVAAEHALLADNGKQMDRIQASGRGGYVQESERLREKVFAARRQVQALFTTSDQYVMRAYRSEKKSTWPNPPTQLSAEMLVVLSTWAHGRSFRASLAARKLSRSRERSAPTQPRTD